MPFIDYLTAMMTLSMAVNVTVMYMAYRLGNPAPAKEKAADAARTAEAPRDDPPIAADGELRAIGTTLMVLGVPVLIFGLAMSITWPLPGGYNLLFGDPFAYLGIVTLIGGALLYAAPSRLGAASLPVGFLSLMTIVYGASILTHGLTSEPAMAFAFYLFEGLGGMATALLLHGQNKTTAYAAIALLAIATIIMLIIDGGAIFQHPTLFAKYTP